MFIFRLPANIQVRVNRNGGLYDNGRAIPTLVRERILDLSHQGLGQLAVAREVRTSHIFVGNVVRNYDKTNSSLRLPRSTFPDPKINATVLEYIEDEINSIHLRTVASLHPSPAVSTHLS